MGQGSFTEEYGGETTLNRRELLDKLSASAEERVLLGRLWDSLERSRSRNVPEASGFLSPHEQALARRLLQTLDVQEGFLLGRLRGRPAAAGALPARLDGGTGRISHPVPAVPVL